MKEADCMMTMSTQPEDLLEPEVDDHLIPCETALQPHGQPIRELITYPVTFLPPPAFKKPCLKPIREFGSSEHQLPILLVWCLQMNTVLS